MFSFKDSKRFGILSYRIAEMNLYFYARYADLNNILVVCSNKDIAVI